MGNRQQGHFINMLLADEGAASKPELSCTQQEQLQLLPSSEGGPECLRGHLSTHQPGLMQEHALDDHIFLPPASAGQEHANPADLRVPAAPAGFQQELRLESPGSSRMIPMTSTGSPLQPPFVGTVVRQQQQQQQQRYTSVPPAASAVTGTPTFQMYRAPPYTTELLVTTGDQLLQEYQGPAFLRAIQRGKYAGHIPFLERMWQHIQSVQLLPAAVAAAPLAGDECNVTAVVQQVSSSLPAPGSAAIGAGAGELMPQHFWCIPPAISGSSSRTRTTPPRQMMTVPAAAGAAAGLTLPSLTAAGSSPPPPFAPPAAAAEPAIATGTSAAYNEFVARNFQSYTSATPIAIGDDRFLIPLKQTNLGALSAQYAGWGFRLWVCAIRTSQQQQQATVSAAAAAASAGTAEAGAELPSDSHMFSEQALLPCHDLCADIIADTSLPRLQDPLDPHEAALLATTAAAAAAAAAAVAMPAVDGGPSASLAVSARGTVADAGSADLTASWPYNSSHASVEFVKYGRDRKTATKAGKGAAAAATAGPGVKKKAAKLRRSLSAASGAQDITGDTYLLDLSVGWCVFAQEPQRISSSSELSQKQAAKRSRVAMDWTPAAAGDGTSPSSSLGLAGLRIATDGGSAEARHQQGPAATATNHQSFAGIAEPPAMDVSAVDELSSLVHQLKVQRAGWAPRSLLSWFQPGSVGASAAVGTLDPSEIREALLQQDVKDIHGRNVLHIVARCEPDRFHKSAAAAAVVTYQLDILLEDAGLRNNLMSGRNDNGATPLVVAAKFGVPEVYNRLLAAADMRVIQTTTKSGWSVLHRLADSAQQAAGDQQAWQRFQQCIDATVQHIVQLAIGAYTSSEAVPSTGPYHPQQQRDRLHMCCDWVHGVVNLPEPTDRHYRGAQVMREADVSSIAQELLQAELSRLGVQL